MDKQTGLSCWSVFALGLVFGCGGQAERVDDSVDHGKGAADTIEVRGRTFVRRDLFSADEYERIIYEGRATQPSTTPEVLAAQMRGHVLTNGAYYIEMEPNVELARRVLADPLYDTGTPAQAPREERGVIGSDSRIHETQNTTWPNTAIGFVENGCTGTRVGARTLMTAAHCVYDTYTTNAWYCANGSTGAPCATWPHWRLGVEDGSGFSGWIATDCPKTWIQSAWVSLTDPNVGSEETWADVERWDYSVVDFKTCAVANGGWLGTVIVADTDLLNGTYYMRGYPVRATCPAGSVGTVGIPAPGGGVQNSDCPGTGNWPGSTYRYNGDTSKPYSGAEIWTSGDSNVAAGSPYGASRITSTIDVTHGNSGGALYLVQANGDRRVVGVLSTAGSTQNVFHRFNSEYYNFMVANTDFPDDTL